MRPVTGTAKMQMRFDLMRRNKPGGTFHLVRGRLLGSWVTPQNPSLGERPGDMWIVNHPVVDLPAPATYRFRVSFRWLGSSGQQLSADVQSSSNCFQKSSARQRFVGPACAAGTNLTVTVDPSHTIDEYDFDNNTLTMPCPTASPSG
jgi:hypothetical protein